MQQGTKIQQSQSWSKQTSCVSYNVLSLIILQKSDEIVIKISGYLVPLLKRKCVPQHSASLN